MLIETAEKKWHWPNSDQKLIQVFDWAEDIKRIIPHVKGFNTCVQAGGAMGQWPYEFSKYFDQVITFEPHPENFQYLENNIEGVGNIFAHQCALSNKTEKVHLELDESEQGNSGAYYVKSNGTIQAVELDNYHLTHCDLIQLDVEGYEAEALQGAEQTILKYSPVIVIEEKPLPHIEDYTKARRLLESWGYREAEKMHRDVIFV